LDNVRGARREEYDEVRNILLEAFRTDDEARLWDYLTLHDPALKPEHVRLALAGERPVACTVVLPRRVSTPRGIVPGAVVTLVACRPEYQRKGFGGATVKSALEHMAEHGLALGVLYGHPTYYPRFGFVPVLSRVLVTAQVDLLPSAGGPDLRPALPEDAEWMNCLYESQLASCPCTTIRSADSWMWQPRNPSKLHLLVTHGSAGYAFVQPSEDNTLVISEALCYRPVLCSRRRAILRRPAGHPSRRPDARTACMWVPRS
jgi:putative acetyltransferase